MRKLWILLALCCLGSNGWGEKATVWIGTGTSQGDPDHGIYRAVLDLETGRLTQPEVAAKIGSPGFLALHPDGNRLYSVCRLANGEGGVAAFKIGSDLSSLELLNTQPIGDGGAAHIAVDRSGRCVFTAQYGGGSVAVFPLDENGELKARSMLAEHEGSGPNQARQQRPHPHWVGTSPDNRFLFVPDLGIDKVMIYRIDPENAEIEQHGSAVSPAGGGPRHMKFHPNGHFTYLLNELHVSVSAFRYDADAGTMQRFQTISSLPKGLWEMSNSASEIRVHPNGKFIYAANRGHDSISVFRVNANTGRLRFVEREAIRGSWPRNFNLDPSGQWLLAAGRKSNTISVFRVDSKTGGLVFDGQVVNCPDPICVEVQVRE